MFLILFQPEAHRGAMHAHILGAGRSLVAWLTEQRGEDRAAASPARR